VRRAACEVELAAGGELVRLDRLVELDDALWVLDYKTGQPDAAELARYQAQLAHYRVLVAPLANGKPVRTALVMMDGHVFETHP
jgi:ATP-dependent helicase/nuclease subunit A